MLSATSNSYIELLEELHTVEDKIDILSEKTLTEEEKGDLEYLRWYEEYLNGELDFIESQQ